MMSSSLFFHPAFIGPSKLEILAFVLLVWPKFTQTFWSPSLFLVCIALEYHTIEINMSFSLLFSDTWIVQSKPRFLRDVLCLMCPMNTLYIIIR